MGEYDLMEIESYLVTAHVRPFINIQKSVLLRK